MKHASLSPCHGSYRFVLAAVSPAVVVPCMLHLNEKGYGVDKGIPTLVIAAASVDDVLAISGFGVVLGIAFSSGLYFFNFNYCPSSAEKHFIFYIEPGFDSLIVDINQFFIDWCTCFEGDIYYECYCLLSFIDILFFQCINLLLQETWY